MSALFTVVASAPPQPTPAEPAAAAPAADDLYALGRRAAAARRARLGDRGSFVRARQLIPGGAWRGPRDAAEAFVEEADLEALGGLGAAHKAGVRAVFCHRSAGLAGEAAAAGLRVIWRVDYRSAEDASARRARLDAVRALADHGTAVWGVVPTPDGEPQGLDTLTFVALCRLELPAVPHVLADFARLGPRLAQMALGFGADELWGPIVGERALRLGANAGNPAMTRREAALLLRGAGLTPCERVAGDVLEEVAA